MIKLAADENFDNRIIRGLRRRLPELDIVRFQDTELAGEEDSILLAWAAKQQRLLVTHDVKTMVKFAYDRVRSGNSMAGVLEVASDLPIGLVIDDIFLIVTCSTMDDWKNQVRYLPL